MNKNRQLYHGGSLQESATTTPEAVDHVAAIVYVPAGKLTYPGPETTLAQLTQPQCCQGNFQVEENTPRFSNSCCSPSQPLTSLLYARKAREFDNHFS